jgi:predicted nuclease with RNAse H fold
MSYRDSVPTVVGVDVGGPKKGFHAVASRKGDISDTCVTLDAGEVVAWCRRLGASSVGIDAPCQWSRTGRARPCERELARGHSCLRHTEPINRGEPQILSMDAQWGKAVPAPYV